MSKAFSNGCWGIVLFVLFLILWYKISPFSFWPGTAASWTLA